MSHQLNKLALPLALALLVGAAPARVWTNSIGRGFEAKFVRLHGSDVIFEMPNGRSFSTPLADLSTADQARVRARGQTRGAVSAHSNAMPADTRSRKTLSTLGHSWPREIRLPRAVPCKVVSEDSTKHRFIYESPGYRFTCDARVTDDARRNFAVMFETTRRFAELIPLSMRHSGSSSGKLNIRLFGETAAYQRAGGPAGSAGLFNPPTDTVMVPMSSLGLVRGGTGFSLDPKRQNTVLIHELAHQLTPRAYFAPGARGWFSEGLAEYMAVTHYNWGYFQTDPHGNTIKAYVTGRGTPATGGRNLGTRISLPPLRQFLLMDYRSFAGRHANRNYGAALLLTHYFFHMEGGGRAHRVTRFLRGLQSGTCGESAVAPLLGGAGYEKLEAEITAAWAKQGVEIRFSET